MRPVSIESALLLFLLIKNFLGRKEVLPNAKTILFIKNRSNKGKNGYHFCIQREKLVQKQLHFQKKQKGPKNL